MGHIVNLAIGTVICVLAGGTSEFGEVADGEDTGDVNTLSFAGLELPNDREHLVGPLLARVRALIVWVCENQLDQDNISPVSTPRFESPLAQNTIYESAATKLASHHWSL
jgi:hypothetical protein